MPAMYSSVVFLGSSMVEHLAVNQRVASSSLAPRAMSLWSRWIKTTDCKSVAYSFVGLNPPNGTMWAWCNVNTSVSKTEDRG